MENGDRNRCRIELRACPEHEDAQRQSIAEAMSREPDPSSIEKWLMRSQCNCGCAEAELSEIVGWCFHCTHQYADYNSKIEDRHFALHCPGAPKELKESARKRLAKHKTGR